MALSESDLAAIKAKVGDPQRNAWKRIELPIEKIREMRAAGFSMNQIADYFDVCRRTVFRRLTGEGRTDG